MEKVWSARSRFHQSGRRRTSRRRGGTGGRVRLHRGFL